jgi:enoyl-CoA hydratase
LAADDGVLVQSDVGAVRWLTITRPEVHNALNRAVLAALSRALDVVERSPRIGAVVITGAGTRAFSAGADLDELAELDATGAHRLLVAGGQVIGRLDRLPVPVIAAVNGLALGGGFELALACTLMMASADARFALPETGLGLMPGYGGTQRLALQAGMQTARMMIVAGEPLSAPDAHRCGLLHHAPSPPELFQHDVQDLAERVVSKGRDATYHARAALRAAEAQGAESGLLLEASLAALCIVSEDAAARVAAFRERRSTAGEGSAG